MCEELKITSRKLSGYELRKKQWLDKILVLSTIAFGGVRQGLSDEENRNYCQLYFT